MNNKFLLILLLAMGYSLSAQETAISGYVDLENIESAEEIYLSQIALEDIPNFNKAKRVATTPIDERRFDFK